eukprot:scaffold13910_cov149-Amphora_coffeaeformis.AAC.1
MVAARTCVEQIIDLRKTLRYLGVPILSNDTNILLTDERVINPTTDKCKGMFVMALLHYLLQCV